ncbi:MAG: ribonuclease J [Christensenellaceae bacterium]|jgi:ribonuclease J|nr:ribonuclease J [Christensenellaceae bacterium]
MAKNLKISFLGGIGEIGKNMTCFEYGDDIIVVDAGLGFPDNTMPGIDMVVADITYLIRNKDKMRGYVITHGHEDHIGGIAYALKDVPATVYGSRMTLGLIENKLREKPGIKVKAVAVRARTVVKIGEFTVEFVQVNHSIPGCFALSITTPVGTVFHSGDFKIDLTPVDGKVIDLQRIGEIGKRGVALLMCESTNVERPGFTMSETTVGERLGELFEQYKDKRLFVASFSSHIHRVQQLLDLAVKYKRKVAFSGRSMLNVSDLAIKLGEMKTRPDNIIEIEKIANYKNEEVLVILTGSQGEAGSALTRMAGGEFAKINLGPDDAVIFSSSPISGNEEAVSNVVNNLIHRGCEVVYESLAAVHVSGHACQEELKLLHALIAPRFFIPVHGEYKMLKKHAQLAEKLGMNPRNIFVPDVGDLVELSLTALKKIGSVPNGSRLIDGHGEGDIDSSVLRDRQALAEDGICIVGIGYNGQNGEIISGPDIMTKGLVYGNEMEKIITEAKGVVLSALGKVSLAGDDSADVRNQIRKDLQNYFNKTFNRRPIVVSMLERV